jgi:plastocyanin
MHKAARLIFVFTHLSFPFARRARSFHALIIGGRSHSGSGCRGRNHQMRTIWTTTVLGLTALLAFATHAIAQPNSQPIAQVIALDECDPETFNEVLSESGGGFCHNVSLAALGYATTLSDLLAGAQANMGDKGWDFEPDLLTIKQGTVISVVDQGGEPHTFTEVKAYGNGFVPPLNPGSSTTVIPECQGGFKNIAVARTRIVQGSHLDIIGLSKGKHLFQCCIHPWMRMEVDVQ